MLVFFVCAMLTGPALPQDQPSAAKTIGVLWSGTADGTAAYWGAFLEGMRNLGWIDGKTAHFVMRFDNDDKTLLPELARQLVALRVDVLAVTIIAAPAARTATVDIPIVVLDSGDPIVDGLTKTLSRPIGNVTGISWQSKETALKRLELIKELIPGLSRLGVLYDSGDSSVLPEIDSYRAATAGSDVALRSFKVRSSREFQAAFAAIKRYQPQALIYPVSVLSASNLELVVTFASGLRLPTFSESAEYVEKGILLSYGADYVDAYQRAAIQVDKILRGAKPTNLPWTQPTQFELVVNMEVVEELGLTIPESIRLRTTRIIP
jgi:ABC-type uncharacterized transport system substrate-binding protein